MNSPKYNTETQENYFKANFRMESHKKTKNIKNMLTLVDEQKKLNEIEKSNEIMNKYKNL